MGVMDTMGPGLAMGAMNYVSDITTNLTNLNLMRQGWEREDTAVQRRVADLRAAGLNPVLAAGSAASSQAPMRLESPQMGNIVRGGLESATAIADAKVKDAQAVVLQKQAEGIDLDNRLKAGTNPAKIADAMNQLEKANIEAQLVLENVNLDMALKRANVALEIAKEGATQQGISLAVVQQIETAANTALKEGQLKEVEARTALAVAIGKLAQMDQSFFEKLGVSPKVIQTIMDVMGPVIRLFVK